MSVGRFYDLASAWDTLVAVASEVFPAFIHRVWRLREGFRRIEIDEHNRVTTLNSDQYLCAQARICDCPREPLRANFGLGNTCGNNICEELWQGAPSTSGDNLSLEPQTHQHEIFYGQRTITVLLMA